MKRLVAFISLVHQNVRSRLDERRAAKLNLVQRYRCIRWRAMADPQIKPPRRVA